jgi:superfamily I DNA and/or RNA helicase
LKISNPKYRQNTIELPGLLSEFRLALTEEIEAARRHESSSAVPLVNGKKIAQIGSAFQYIFQIENILNLPGDAPGDLILPGRLPLSVIIISIDGLKISLSIPEDIGDFVPSARLQSNLAFLMRKLIERIEAYGGKPNPVGERIMAPELASGTLSSFTIDNLDNYQKQAVTCSISFNTSFIWGPPGTGKTSTIGEIGNQLYKKQRSVLLVSHTNTAVDQAILRISKNISEDELTKGMVLRVGEPKDRRLIDQPNLLLATHVAKKAEEFTTRKQYLIDKSNNEIRESKRLSHLIDLLEWVDEAEEDIFNINHRLMVLQKREQILKDDISEFDRVAYLKRYWNEAENEARKINQLILKSEFIKNKKDIQSKNILDTNDKLSDLSNKLLEAQKIYEHTSSVGLLTRRWKQLPDPEDQKRVVDEIKIQIGKLGLELDDKNNSYKAYNQEYLEYIEIINNYKNEKGEPEIIISQAANYFDKLNELSRDIESKRKLCSEFRNELDEILINKLSAVKAIGLVHSTVNTGNTAETMLKSINQAFDEAYSEVRGLNLYDMKNNLKKMNDSIIQSRIEIDRIDEALKHVEDLIISEASIVATTLTRVYLRDFIQNRRFDSVILDEASMAPIPALWIAASLADKNAIVVGDPRQLPPIVISNHDLAKKWLGRDIFEAAGLKGYQDEKRYLTMLRRQYRMHPSISKIANKLIYEGRLEDGNLKIDGQDCDLSDVKCDKLSLSKWYDFGWGHDHPVLLIDTGSAGAWVTGVSRGNHTSRLNFLSATIGLELAYNILNSKRQQTNQRDDNPRISIICPYRAHSKLLNLLIKEQNLEEEIRAGTVHNFQGSESDVVILDLVNDEPHFRVGMFIPKLDDMTKRLINVAVTRAKRRLFILGDFDYIEKLSKKAFLGSLFIPFLKKNFPIVNALELFQDGLSGRIAKTQSIIYGDDVRHDDNRILLTQSEFYPFLRNDIANSKYQVVIYSAFMTRDRLLELRPAISEAIDRGIMFYVITKAIEDRSKHDLSIYRDLENMLTEIGVVVVHKRKMHEKLVFIDENIVWVGSLNTLSFSNTQEIMERRVSKTIVSDYMRTLRLNELISEYQDGFPKCPICGDEIVASEGKKDPFYWRCVQDNCYSRSIDQPKLEGSKITCPTCAGRVEYGEWGGKPHWRCVKNRKHRLSIARTHLLLPEMRKIIPKEDLKKIDKMFGIEKLGPSPKDVPRQADLFSFLVDGN